MSAVSCERIMAGSSLTGHPPGLIALRPLTGHLLFAFFFSVFSFEKISFGEAA